MSIRYTRSTMKTNVGIVVAALVVLAVMAVGCATQSSPPSTDGQPGLPEARETEVVIYELST